MLKFVDLFAGMGGFNIGFSKSCDNFKIKSQCVMTSEIKPAALRILRENFQDLNLFGDITTIKSSDIPAFDVLLAGFPCQPFSMAGNRHGFLDTRGTLFFEIERIIKEKNPSFFLLENVEGLVKHDSENPKDKMGRTLKTILKKLEYLGYKVSWRLIDASSCGVAQARKRVYIVGSLYEKIDLSDVGRSFNKPVIKNIMESGLPTIDDDFTKKLFSHFSINQVIGKSINDKRGGNDNIHSWDFCLKGKLTKPQVCLLNKIFKERRRKIWAEQQGVAWMDGMPLTFGQIKTFFNQSNLSSLLNDLCEKGYLKHEHPKDLVDVGGKKVRIPNTKKEKGYNLVAGKLSYPINKILNPNGQAPTLVATDLDRLVVVDGAGLRRLSQRECLRLCGYPDNYKFTSVSISELYDLIGNTVVVNVIEEISNKISEQYLRFCIN